MQVQQLQLFAWQSAARGNDVHLNANPTQGEILHEKYIQKKETLKSTNKVDILSKYGGEEYLKTAPTELLTGQTENYVEYSRAGTVMKGKERAKARSKYPEDGDSVLLMFASSLTSCQSSLTITPRYGDHGMTKSAEAGALHVVIQRFTYPTVLERRG
jgi:hypothetical protein